MDFFDILLAKKLEDDRGPTIEGLSVTENGTYREEGKAYSPVIVEVPEPTLITKSITANGTYTASDDNADGYSSVTVAVDGFKKKSIANTPTDIASFNDGTANPMPSLEISIEPVQRGSGDPSPQNVRPISGWSGANVTVADDLTTPTTTRTIFIRFIDANGNPITVYDGTLNVTTGELTATRVSINLEDYTSSISFNAGYNCWVLPITPLALFKGNYDVPDILTSVGYIPRTFYYGSKGDNSIGITNLGQLFIGNNSSTVKPTGQVVYPIATPQTYQLTPTQVTTLLNRNNISANCGQILQGEYFVTL